MTNAEEMATRAGQLLDQGKLDEAYTLAEEVLKVDPKSSMAHQVIGLTFARRDMAHEAIERLTYALSLRPDMVPSHCDLGVAYTVLGDTQKAVECFETALRLMPEHPFSRFNRAQAWLQMGRLHEGWIEYGWRWATGLVQRPSIPVPCWDGSDPAGRSILVHTEQGLGDTIQFVRMLPFLKRRGARVLFACQPALRRLLDGIEGVDEWFPIDQKANVNFDYYISLMSLPGLCGIDAIEDIPSNVPYVRAEPDRVERWRAYLEPFSGLKVGLNWQGTPTNRKDKLRSIPLNRFAPLADVDGVNFFSLHKGPGESQIETNSGRFPLQVLPGLDDEAPFVDTAAVMMNVDLVVTTDTSVAHLAGALARPVWVPLSTACDWRFFLERTDSPWYPTMRLFRQPSAGDWESVVAELTAALRQFKDEWSQAHAAGAPTSMAESPSVPVSVGELLDKITILQIKSERITDESKLANIRRELELLDGVRAKLPSPAGLAPLMDDLKKTNEQLWEIEDEIREKESASRFDDRFVELARAVYKTNDHRSVVKRRINELLGSELIEEKSYKK